MKSYQIFAITARYVVPGSVLALTFLTASCRLPSRETWAAVQKRGLIPVMREARALKAECCPPADTKQDPKAPAKVARLGADLRPSQPVLHHRSTGSTPVATPVPGTPGFVYSPHAAGRKLIDVRKYVAGARVGCPYTMLPFEVPDFSSHAMASRGASEQDPGSQKNPVPSAAQEPSPAREAANPDPTPPTLPPTGELPYGTRVPDRPGFVYSPFATREQLVDVAGIATGVEVKCPYTGKLFRVPDPLPGESAPPPPAPDKPNSPDVPPSPAPLPTDNPGAPAPPPAPAPSADANAAASTVPTATWADKEKNLVQSPFGAPGQMVDVSGRPAGSRMLCPFTNKEFVIPAP